MSHGDHREEIHVEHPHAYDTHEPRSSAIAIFGILTAVLLVVVAVGIQFYYTQVLERGVYQQVLAPEGEQLKALRYKEDWELSHYTHYDQPKGLVRVPLDRAMQLVIAESASPKYPTNPSPVNSPEQLAASTPAVSQPGAAANNAAQQPGVGAEGAKTPLH